MARINWEEFKAKTDNQTSEGGNGVKVGYFSLKNDQDEAVVRFMHDTVEDFDLLVVHKTQDEKGRFKSVNCLRNPEDPIDMCPICADGGKTEYKIFIHLLEYVRQEDGTVKPLARVWERTSSYAKKLANLMNEYGPLSDCLFKIKRNGAKGNLKTEYDIMYLSDRVYPSNIYVKDTRLFENYTALGHAVLDKSYEELTNESMSVMNNVEEPTYQAKAPTVEAPTYTAPPVINNVMSATNNTASVPTYTTPTPTERPVRTYGVQDTVDTANAGRPRRYYN